MKITGHIVCDKQGRPARSFGHFAVNYEKKDAMCYALTMQKAIPKYKRLYEYIAPVTIEVGKSIKT